MKAVLWDLDGTLIDSVADIAAAVDRMLVRTGRRPLGEQVVRGFVGDGARKLVDRCVEAAGGRAGAAEVSLFMEEYGAAPVVHTRVYPGILDLLARVRAPMALVTNKPEQLSRTILAELGLVSFFSVVIGGDTLPVRKPDPEPVRLALRSLGVLEGVLVGDGPADVGAARAAGVPLIGVGWGIGRPDGAEVVLGAVAELGPALSAHGIALDR